MSFQFRKHPLLVLVLATTIVALIACQSPTPMPTPTVSPVVTPVRTLPSSISPLPVPPAAATVAGPVPSTTAAVARPVTQVPTPAPGSGVVVGFAYEEKDRGPLQDGVIYLGEVVGEKDNFPLVSVDRQTSPYALPSKETGKYIFPAVRPGKYGVVFWSPDANFLASDPDRPERSLMITVEAGKTLEIAPLFIPER